MGPMSTIGGVISPASNLANGLMTNEKGTAVCFITSSKVGTLSRVKKEENELTCPFCSVWLDTTHLYMDERMKRGPQLPWSLVTKGVVTKGGTAPV